MNRALLKEEALGEVMEAALPSESSVSEETVTEEPQNAAENSCEAEIEQSGEAICEDVVAVGTAADDLAAESTDDGAEVELAPAPVEATATEEVVDTEVNVEHLRMAEALLFAASEPLSEEALKASLPERANIKGIIAELQTIYEKRGVNLVLVAEKWQFRTAPDLAFLLRKEKPEQKKLSRAAIETLAIIAYHQPVTRAEVEDIRGVMLSKGTLDTLMEVGWIKIRGRKRTPGRPVTYGTTEAFLVHFGLENISHLPGMDELKAAGFLEAIPPSGLDIPSPSDQLAADEDPYEGPEEGELATGGADPFIPGSSAE
ncbi:segregation and condensation protein B [Rhizomicrobium palustre]|uniref:Segregation and condensation protein B n=2 Tax=Rhizomicrobium palustre TaxID=189966 RepID=A0A846N3M1_9PROT|nr:SMC-Scp complex subunit ScpB [Rhizomicrobium palustre]NIK90203.1 segregation and condensation protein B [Rhizomicrobium palustre]